MTTTADRLAAGRAIGRVMRHGAWSNVVSRVEASLEGADVAAVQGIVFAALRSLPAIDAALAQAARRSLDEIDPAVVDLLRVAVAELVDRRTPGPLVVDSIVHAVRGVHRSAAGFANAVLRRISEAPPTVETLDDIGVPGFVDEALRHVLEPKQVDAFWWACQQSPAVGLRSHADIEGATRVAEVDDAWLWTSGGSPPVGIPIQDPASVAVGNAVEAGPGDGVLDVAAAPGGKTAHLVDQVGDAVVAMDRSRRRVRDAASRVPAARWMVADGTRLPFVESVFDRVLVDAPCTGLGTLRRRPEIRYRVRSEEMLRLATVQRAMLTEALRVVHPGGRVVYSVCTVTPLETIDVVAGLGGRPPDGLPGIPYGDGWLMAPHLGTTDGMFICIFDRH